MLDKEFQYFIDHQEELVAKYEGKILVIKNEEVIGTYDSKEEAYFKSLENQEEGTFLIQECAAGEEVYTVSFYPKVRFA